MINILVTLFKKEQGRSMNLFDLTSSFYMYLTLHIILFLSFVLHKGDNSARKLGDPLI